MVQPRTDLTGVVATVGNLDLDDPGAEVGEHHRAIGSGEDSGEIDDECSVKRAFDGRRCKRHVTASVLNRVAELS